jgi:branched-subunit amino acid transport protein AzlD
LNVKALRNILIVVVLAAAVAFLPGGGKTAVFISSLLSTAILVIFALLAVRAYRENRVALFSLGDRHRALLYAAPAAVVLALAGRDKLLDTGAGTLVFFLLLFGAVAALYAVWQHHRSYGY